MWHVQTASETGRSHRRTGAPLQDRTCARTEYGVTAAVLADGAGVLAVAGFGPEESRLAQPGEAAYEITLRRRGDKGKDEENVGSGY